MKQGVKSQAGRAPRRATMSDVAKRANVSISTVSHVLNGTAPISEEAAGKVIAAVKELHYMPNALARGLRQRQTMVIGLVVPEVRNEFYVGCASAVLQAADREAYTVLLCDCCYDLQREERSVRALIERRVDGLIFFGGSGDEGLIRLAHQSGIAVVLGDRSMDGYSSVEFTNVKAMRKLVKTLYDMGKKRFCYVSEPIEMQNLRERYEGFLQGLADCGLQNSQHELLVEKWLQQEKIETARKLIVDQLCRQDFSVPDVYITSCDAIAIGIIAGLAAKGLRVPEDVGVVGFDNMAVAAYTNPPLTTVEQNVQRIGEHAFELLHNILSQKTTEPVHVMLESRLILRESVK